MLMQLNRQARPAVPTPAQTPDLGGLVDLYHAYQAARDPAGMLRQLAAQNPMLAQLRELQTGGQDMQSAFYALCKKQGVDPESILSQFR